LSAQELGERLRPDQMKDLDAAGLAPADFYPEPDETVGPTISFTINNSQACGEAWSAWS